MNSLVCPDCGCADFTQRRIARIEYGVRVIDGCEYDTGREEIVDGGDRDEPLVCDDCGASYDELSTLITEDTYNESEDE